MQKISCFIITLNEEKKLRTALQSVAWCDEIVIVDSGSIDKTLDIAKKFNAKIFHRDWTGYRDQKQFGLNCCTNNWILNIDADEVVSDPLRKKIQSLHSEASINGYELSRVVFYQNIWWRLGGWFPEYRLRLFKKDQAIWKGSDPHEHVEVNGKIQKLTEELYHYTYDDLTNHVEQLVKHAKASAKFMYTNGKDSTLLKAFLRALSRFVKFYIFKKGFLDGSVGLLVGLLEGFYTLLKYAFLWEMNKNARARKI